MIYHEITAKCEQNIILQKQKVANHKIGSNKQQITDLIEKLWTEFARNKQLNEIEPWKSKMGAKYKLLSWIDNARSKAEQSTIPSKFSQFIKKRQRTKKMEDIFKGENILVNVFQDRDSDDEYDPKTNVLLKIVEEYDDNTTIVTSSYEEFINSKKSEIKTRFSLSDDDQQLIEFILYLLFCYGVINYDVILSSNEDAIKHGMSVDDLSFVKILKNYIESYNQNAIQVFAARSKNGQRFTDMTFTFDIGSYECTSLSSIPFVAQSEILTSQ